MQDLTPLRVFVVRFAGGNALMQDLTPLRVLQDLTPLRVL